MSKINEPNRRRKPEFPARTALSRNQSIRSILKIGRSHAVTIPAAWLRSVYRPEAPFLLVTVNNDGTLTLKPLGALTAPDPDQSPADPHDRDPGPQQRETGT